MKNLKLNIVIFIIAYLVFMLANLPAAMVLGMLKLPATVKLGEVNGTIWQGEASAVQFKRDVLTEVKWDLNVLALLTGKLSADVDFGKLRDSNSISGKGTLRSNFAMDHFSAADFTLRYPAAEFVERLQLSLPTILAGRMILELETFDQGAPYCEALNGNVRWVKAGWQGLSGPIKVGTLEGELACQQGEIELKISKANPLGLQITTLIGANNKLTTKGFAQPNGEMPTEVHNMARQLGKPDSQGRYALDF